jgi:hypothetical protein
MCHLSENFFLLEWVKSPSVAGTIKHAIRIHLKVHVLKARSIKKAKFVILQYGKNMKKIWRGIKYGKTIG